MKLFEAPRNVFIRLVDSGAELYFERIDGMYSVCKNHAGEIVYVMAFTEVEVLPQPQGNPT